jgi:hypothetical protein
MAAFHIHPHHAFMKYLSYTFITFYTALIFSLGGFAIHLAAAGDNNREYAKALWLFIFQAHGDADVPLPPVHATPKAAKPAPGRSKPAPAQPAGKPASKGTASGGAQNFSFFTIPWQTPSANQTPAPSASPPPAPGSAQINPQYRGNSAATPAARGATSSEPATHGVRGGSLRGNR